MSIKQNKSKNQSNRQSMKVNWDKPNPKFQYDIFKGYGNPLPGSATPSGFKK